MDDIRLEAARLLGQIDPRQPLGTKLFNAIARLSVSVALEAVILRVCGKPEVYLVQRSLEETAYPEQLHCPGSFLRPGEEFPDVFQRLERETGISFLKIIPTIAINNVAEARGHILQQVFFCKIKKNPQGTGKWFPINSLPDNTVKQHKNVIIPQVWQFALANRLF